MNEIKIKDDIYYIAYSIIKESFEKNKFNLKDTLLIIKNLFNCNDVILFKKNKDRYIACNKINNKKINILVNDNYKLIEKNKIINICNISFVLIKNNHVKYILSLVNLPNDFDINKLKVIVDTLSLILEKNEQFKKIKKKTNIDKLTGLYNRNAYENSKKIIDKSSKKIHYVLFDLFRLKYINDNFSHDMGDKYIIETSNILIKHFKNDKLYRIGGDEFVLITKKDIDEINFHINQIKKEVKSINLKLDNATPLLINYGISSKENNELMKELYIKADKLLQQDKYKTYDELKIKRRK